MINQPLKLLLIWHLRNLKKILDFSKPSEEIENVECDRKSKKSLQEIIQDYQEIIRDVALTVIAIPPTQVSVERLFSVLKLIKTDLRGSMKEDLVEAMIFLRTLNFKWNSFVCMYCTWISVFWVISWICSFTWVPNFVFM